MGVEFTGTVERMKSAAGLRSDTDLAKTLNITPQAVSNFKNKGEIPTDLVIQFAVKYKVSVDWLLTGEGEIQRGGKQPFMAAEETVAYNVKDMVIQEIVEFLEENPVDKKVILKLIKSKKMAKEAMEEFAGVKGLVEES